VGGVVGAERLCFLMVAGGGVGSLA
jgi:hypothetical protein